MASASASASSSYAAASSSNFATTSDERSISKFGQYRSRVMLGDLPADFLRIQLTQPMMYPPQGWTHPHAGPQVHHQNPSFLGFFTLTIAEARLVKNSSLLGLIKMDPYVTFRIGHVHYDTPTATSGGKNPQWKASYRINLFKGMDMIHLEVYDQRNFTEDSFIGECDIPIPNEVMQGETRQSWFPLYGRPASANENQGDILIIMSFLPVRQTNPSATSTPANAEASRPHSNSGANSTASASPSHQVREQLPPLQHSSSVTPKPPPPPYTAEDVRSIEEMFPTTDRRYIIDLMDKNGGNKDLVVNQLLQNAF